MRKRLLLFLFCICFIVTVLLVHPTMAADIIASGTCGQTVYWSLSSDGVLDIYGTGSMTNYSSYNDMPWYRYGSYIHSVYVWEGVTSIGEKAFYSIGGTFGNLTSVQFPSSLTTIGSSAFRKCTNLSKLNFSKGLRVIGEHAFQDCSNITRLYIANGLTTIKLFTLF